MKPPERGNASPAPTRTSMRNWRVIIGIGLAILLTFSRTIPRINAQLIHAQLGHSPEVIVIDAKEPGHPFPHFWEQMFGSGRAILALRDSYRRDLRAVEQITGFKYVRFHGIFDDEVGVYDEDGRSEERPRFAQRHEL